MKKFKFSMLALSALVGGSIAASAASAPPSKGYSYDLDVDFYTNAMKLVSVSGVPADPTTTFVEGNQSVIQTDGSGKIDGVANLLITNLHGTLAQGFYVADISGSISTVGKSNTPTVKMTLKGNGYAQSPLADAGTQGSSVVNLNFSGTLSTVPTTVVGPFTTNVLVIVLNRDGTTNYTYNQYYYPQAVYSGYTQYAFNYHYSEITSNLLGGTNYVIVNDVIDWQVIDVGPSLGTDINTNLYIPRGDNYFVTNWQVIVAQGKGVNFTNNYYGLDPSNLGNYLAQLAYNPSNGILKQVVVLNSSFTNPVSAYTNGGPITFKNGYDQVSGTWSGSIKTTASGTTSGSFNQTVKDSPATLQAYHTVYTAGPVIGTNDHAHTGWQIVYSMPAGGEMDAFNKDYLYGRVVQFGNKLWTSGAGYYSGDDGYNGSGTITTKSKSTGSGANKVTVTTTNFTAKLTGIAYNKGSSLSLSGTNGPLSQFPVDTNQPPVVETLVNQASTNLQAFSVTNRTANVLSTNVDYTYPATVVTNAAAANSWISSATRFAASFAVPPSVKTNTVPNAIRYVEMSGKVIGQTLPTKPVAAGVNPTDVYPWDPASLFWDYIY